MHRVNNGERDVLILDALELDSPELLAVAGVELRNGNVVSADGIGIHAEGKKFVVTGTVDGKPVQLTTDKDVTEVLSAVAEYRTADRVLAVLS